MCYSYDMYVVIKGQYPAYMYIQWNLGIGTPKGL